MWIVLLAVLERNKQVGNNLQLIPRLTIEERVTK